MASHQPPEETQHDSESSSPPAHLPTFDPAAPPSRPGSALSNESFPSSLDDLSGTEYGEQEDTTIPHKTITLVKLRDGGQCLLCGSTEDLVVTRVALQGDDNASRMVDPFRWLIVLNLMAGRDSFRGEIENLMTLCKPHADAYDAEVWCWLPSARFRAEMGGHAAPDPLPPLPAAPEKVEYIPILLSDSDEDGDGYGHGMKNWCWKAPPREDFLFEGVSTLARKDGEHPRKMPIHFTPAESRLFDVLIFLPDDMPPVPELGDHRATRVLRDWRVLSVNPYVAYAVALRTVGAAYFPPPDAALRAVEEECVAIREQWNAAVPRHAEPVIAAKYWQFYD